MTILEEPPPFTWSAAVEEPPSGLIRETLPSGAVFTVLTEAEAEHLRGRVAQYHEQLSLSNVSDLATLDTVIGLELLIYRYNHWLSMRCRYDSSAVDEGSLLKSVRDLSAECRLLKKTLGIDKVTRDRQRGDGSVAHFIARLAERAGRFGVMRSATCAKAIELGQQVLMMVDWHKGCDEEERREYHLEHADIFAWLDTTYRKELGEVDAAFRAGDQQFWIREQ